MKGHSHFRLYDLLTYWYGRVIFYHFDVEIGTVVLPMSYGCRHSPQDSLCCCGLPYVVIVAVIFTFWGLVQVSFTHRLGDCIFIPRVGCLSFPQWLRLCRTGYYSTRLLVVYVVTLWGCRSLFGVVFHVKL